MPSGSSSTPKYQKSKVILKTGLTIASINIKVTYKGSIKFYLCADGNTETWEELTLLSSATPLVHEFSTTGTEIKWYAVLAKGSEITEVRASVA